MDREEYLAAVAQAAKWAEEYYDNDEASVTDYEYDMHMQIIKKVEAEHPDAACRRFSGKEHLCKGPARGGDAFNSGRVHA